jgi:signal transduction histidine kinase
MVKGEAVGSEQQSLSERLQRLRGDPANGDHPLMAEVEFFAGQCLRLGRTQEKLIAISDAMQGQLAERSHELAALNRQKDLFFSIVAHDLRGPLGSFGDFASLLLVHYDQLDESRRKALLANMQQAGEGIRRLLENLLAWARIQMGQVELRRCLYPLDELTAEAAALFEPEFRRKGVALLCPASGLHLLTDREALLTILRNLLGNAVKFTPQGGAVGVEAGPGDGAIWLRVADTGIGMAPEVLEGLFDIGVKSVAMGTDNEVGSGLGLILCQELAHRLGGRIEARSEPGIGSEFVLHLPGPRDG